MELLSKIYIILFFLTVVHLISCEGQPQNKFIDSRDGKAYRYVVLSDSSEWIIQSLNYEIENTECGNSDPACQKGRYYSWEGAKKVCPKGWHLPNILEWEFFIENYGCCNEAGKTINKLITLDDRSKISYFQKRDSSYRTEAYWSSSQEGNSEAWGYLFIEEDKDLFWFQRITFPVDGNRPLAKCLCTKDKKLSEDLLPVIMPNEEDTLRGILIDNRDKQTYSYKVMKDGKKWMTQNLNFENKESYCYNNQYSRGEELGRLYSWNAAVNACPKGWHLPSDNEWISLVEAYGGGYFDWDKEKMVGDGNISYKVLTENGVDGFNPQFGGFRDVCEDYIEFKNLFNIASYWTSTASQNKTDFCGNPEEAYNYQFSKKGTFRRSSASKFVGRSCRCVED